MVTKDSMYSHTTGQNSQKNAAMLNLKNKPKRRKASKVARKQRKINRK